MKSVEHIVTYTMSISLQLQTKTQKAGSGVSSNELILGITADRTRADQRMAATSMVASSWKLDEQNLVTVSKILRCVARAVTVSSVTRSD